MNRRAMSGRARHAAAVLAVLTVMLGTGVPAAGAALDGTSSIDRADRDVERQQQLLVGGSDTTATTGATRTSDVSSSRAELTQFPADPDAKEGEAAGEDARVEKTAPDARVRPVSVKVVADDSYRKRFPHWRQKVKAMVERADNRLADVYGIDLTVTSTGRWRIGDPGDCSYWLGRLYNVDDDGADIVVGVSYGGYRPLAGCAYRLSDRIAMRRQGDRADWITLRHEVSHLYGAYDRYDDSLCDNPNHRNDLMECAYRHPNWWSNEPGDGDRRIIRRHSERFN